MQIIEQKVCILFLQSVLVGNNELFIYLYINFLLLIFFICCSLIIIFFLIKICFSIWKFIRTFLMIKRSFFYWVIILEKRYCFSFNNRKSTKFTIYGIPFHLYKNNVYPKTFLTKSKRKGNKKIKWKK